MKCSGKTEQAVVMCGMVFLVGGRSGAAIGLMQAQLGKRKIVKGRSLSELGTNDRK